MAGVDVEMDDSGVPDFQSDMEQIWVLDIAGDLLGLEHEPELDPNAEPELDPNAEPELEAETEQESEAGAREGEDKVQEVIHCWSSGRYFHSTALMYSFAQRDDMEVLDEPLYANYLTKTGFQRPCRKKVLSTMESDGKKVIDEVIYGPRQKNYRFCKNISKQLPAQASDLLGRGKHFLLIRNPLDILPAYEKNEPPSFFELGIGQLYSIYCHLCASDKPPAIIDAADLEQDPEVTLRDLCNDLDIEFDPKMLSWEAGPKPIDGPWASYRYKTVHQSTGFEAAKTRCQPFPMSMYGILEQNLPLYSMLRGYMKKNSPPLDTKLLAWVDNQFVFGIRRAKVSVFDSTLHGGDSVWEGLRVDNRRIFKLDEHLDRLLHSANALFFSNIPTREEVKKAILKTLVLNGMHDGGYIRLTLSHGRKATLNMRANVNVYRPSLIVFPKGRIREFESTHNIILVTVGTRREPPNNLDPEVRHGNLLRNELAKMEGKRVEAHAHALMVTNDGFVSETSDMNIFMVKNDVVFTPRADKCLPGITRAAVMDLVAKAGKILQERDIGVLELYTADEIWTTGSEYVLTPVVKVDGRTIGDGEMGPLTKKLQQS